MKYHAFLSFSNRTKSTLQLAYHLRDALVRREYAPFLFVEEYGSSSWRDEMLDALAAPVMFALVDKEYFGSEYCFFEWLAYQRLWEERKCVTASKSAEKLGSICAFDLRDNPHSQEPVTEEQATKFARAVHAKLVSDRSQNTPWVRAFAGHSQLAANIVTPETLADKVLEWHKIPFEKNAAPPKPELVCDTVATAVKLQAEIDVEPYPPAHRDRLERAGRIALFCLGFDRFFDGGWGFSLDDSYIVPSGGRADLAGSDEANILVLRALTDVLTRDSYCDEVEELKKKLDVARRKTLPVSDRRPTLTSILMRVLEGAEISEAARAMDVFVKDLLDANPVRYSFLPPTAEPPYASALEYAYLCRVEAVLTIKTIQGAAKDAIARNLESRHVSADSTQVDVKFGSLMTTIAVRKSGLLAALSGIEPLDWAASLQTGAATHPSRVLSLLQVRLLASDAAFVEKAGRRFVDSIPVNLNQLLGREADPSVRTLVCLILCDVAFHLRRLVLSRTEDGTLRSYAQKVNAAFRKVWREIQEDLSADKSWEFLSSMNCIGWASLVLLLSRQLVPLPRGETGTGYWRTGVELRKSFAELIRGLQADAQSALLGRVRRSLLGPRGPLNAGEVDSSAMDAFAERLLSRGVLVASQPHALIEGAIDRGLRRLIGVLEIERVPAKESRHRDELRIRSADRGYAKLFLAPFSASTRVRADSIERMKRHFGAGDDGLVANIGEVVVSRCFRISGDSLLQDSFVRRTNDITDKLIRAATTSTDSEGEAEQDILELRVAGSASVRYVLRSASAARLGLGVGVPTHGGAMDDGVRTPDVLIRWVFCDISNEWRLGRLMDHVKGEPGGNA